MTVAGSSGGFSGVGLSDVADAGSGPGVFGEDLALQVGDDDVVVVAVDEDLVEGLVHVELVEHLVQSDGAAGAHRPDVGVGGQVRGRLLSGAPVSVRGWPFWVGSRRIGFRGCLPRRRGRYPTGQGLVGTVGVVDVVERIDLGLQFGQRVGAVRQRPHVRPHRSAGRSVSLDAFLLEPTIGGVEPPGQAVAGTRAGSSTGAGAASGERELTR